MKLFLYALFVRAQKSEQFEEKGEENKMNHSENKKQNLK